MGNIANMKEMFKLKIITYQYETARAKDEGIRIGATRFPPRGVKKINYAKDNYFDIWYPNLAPSKELLKKAKQWDLADQNDWRKYSLLYERELVTNAAARHSVFLLAEIAKKYPIAVGCYCADEQQCHRSILYRIIRKAAEGKWIE